MSEIYFRKNVNLTKEQYDYLCQILYFWTVDENGTEKEMVKDYKNLKLLRATFGVREPGSK